MKPGVAEDRASQLKLLIARGKEQGYLTYSEVNDHLPNEIVDPEQIEDVVNMINVMGITVHEKAPDDDSVLLSDAPVADNDDDAAEAAAALATVDSEFGRTTDPVRMYMREMGTVELLTREGEIRIAKRIEQGLNQVRRATAMLPRTPDILIETWDEVHRGDKRLNELLTGFIDPNAPDEIAKPVNTANGEKKSTDDDEKKKDDGPDPEEAKRRFATMKRAYNRMISGIETSGSSDPKVYK
ncbi:MAG: RNA polymerase sigma factor RpoD, partial [Gammaproteobacteria bacterium]|nr:RNA polymerase sigma factor RpoD [Gammaproteobacteria bacterium]